MDGEEARTAVPPRVGVIGAGISGLTAARTLAEQGLQVEVFDKGRGVGGRCSIRRADGWTFDHGAQYFTVRDERFERQVQAWLDEGVVREWHGRIAVLSDGVVAPAMPQTRYVGVPAMNRIAKRLADGLAVHTGVQVSAVEVGDGGAILRDDRQQDLGRFDAVVVAVPPEQAAALVAEAAPSLAERARACPMVPCWAVMLGLAQRLHLDFDGVFVQGSPVSWAARNGSKPGRPEQECWVLHASGEWSARHVEESHEDVSRRLGLAFADAAGLASLVAEHASAHRWRFALPAQPLSEGCLWDGSSRVALCGDWCCGARVEGAFLSGLAAARTVLRLHG